jgi:hypothetical protein
LGYTHFKKPVGTQGLYAGVKGAETAVINSAGAVISGVKHVLTCTFQSLSSAQSVYQISPVTGIVTTVWHTAETAALTAAYTVSSGSAGSNIATATITSISIGLATAVALSATPGTSVTRGDVIKFARGTQGTVGVTGLTVVINQLA